MKKASLLGILVLLFFVNLTFAQESGNRIYGNQGYYNGQKHLPQINTGLRKGASELIALFGRDRARQLLAMSDEARALVRALIARHAIACDLKSGSLYVAYKKSDPAWMAEEVELLHKEFGHQAATLLSKAELDQYNVLLEEQAFPFEEKAIELHELNAKRAASGVYDKWVKSSFDALRELRPVRYGKTEVSEGVVDAIR